MQSDRDSLFDDAATGPNRRQRQARAALYTALVAISIWTLRDFIPALIWTGVIAIALWPLLHRLERQPLLARQRALLALLLAVGVGVVLAVPFLLVAVQAAAEARELSHWVHRVMAEGFPAPDLLQRLPWGGEQASVWWQNNLTGPLADSPVTQSLRGVSFLAATRSIGGHVVHGLLIVSFMLLTLFFVFRSGARLGQQLLDASSRVFGAAGTSLLRRMADAVRGTVAGLVLVGLGEGVLLGIAYVVAGVPHGALLGLVTAIAAMLPFCAPLVFAAVALWLFGSGATVAAIAVFAVGCVVVFIAEHFVRPMLIGSTTRLPFLLVLFGILGGAKTFGLVGLFIGPALMTVLVVLWAAWAEPSAVDRAP
ncbi:AI-2E family transporter [Alcaligenaceae bacterium B3P038]|nr:AI-2E family transporter [Alcaligenaceae bacterium B3P038]